MFLRYDELIFEIDKGDQEYIVVSTAKFTPDTWYHVAATYDNLASITKIYINGLLSGQVGGTIAPAEIGFALVGGITEWPGWYLTA